MIDWHFCHCLPQMTVVEMVMAMTLVKELLTVEKGIFVCVGKKLECDTLVTKNRACGVDAGVSRDITSQS